MKNEKNVISEIMEHNKQFVKNREYQKYSTTKTPDRNMVIISCMDTRLTTMLPDALGIRNGDVKMIKNAGGIISSPTGGVMRSILVAVYAFDVTNIVFIGHDHCGMANVDNSYLLEKMRNRGISEEIFRNLDSLQIDVKKWLAGFEHVEDAISSSVDLVKNHPLIAKDVSVYGLVINPETGELRQVK